MERGILPGAPALCASVMTIALSIEEHNLYQNLFVV